MSIGNDRGGAQRPAHGLIGSLREALAAASRDDTSRNASPPPQPLAAVAALPPQPQPKELADMRKEPPSAAEAARDARGGTPNIPPANLPLENDGPPTTRVLRGAKPAAEAPTRTQLVRGKSPISRQSFHQDPVVGWLVVVGGPGLGAYRPIYEGNNTLGRASTQRIPIDFGDDAISSEEQAYIRYDGGERSFLFVPNLAKTNVVAINDKRPTAAVPMQPMDLITMGRTQLVFVPLCGPDFDWGDIADTKA